MPSIVWLPRRTDFLSAHWLYIVMIFNSQQFYKISFILVVFTNNAFVGQRGILYCKTISGHRAGVQYNSSLSIDNTGSYICNEYIK